MGNLFRNTLYDGCNQSSIQALSQSLSRKGPSLSNVCVNEPCNGDVIILVPCKGFPNSAIVIKWNFLNAGKDKNSSSDKLHAYECIACKIALWNHIDICLYHANIFTKMVDVLENFFTSVWFDARVLFWLRRYAGCLTWLNSAISLNYVIVIQL